MDPVILNKIDFNPLSARIRTKMHIKEGSSQEGVINSLVEKARQLARPKALYTIAGIDEHLERGVILGGIRMESRVMTVNFKEVHRVFPYIVTAGRELFDWTQSKDDLLDKYYADEISQMALRAAEEYLLTHLKETYQLGKTSSMNPGSIQDWPITAQPALFQLLGNPQEAIGVELLDSMLMIPNQSVSGIRYSSESDFYNCELCPRKQCDHRRAPYDESLLREKYQ